MLVVGNWKMNTNRGSAEALVSAIAAGLDSEIRCGVVVCVPYVFLGQTQQQLTGSRIQLGAQNVSEYDSGAYTGEVSAAMLREFGCDLVLVGHSERRQLFHETDGQVVQKAIAAQSQNLLPVVCVGETLEQRESGQTDEVITGQVEAILSADVDLNRVVWAYEPVWAIGTGRTATPEQAQAVHALIRGLIAQRDSELAQKTEILYGGSVNAENAATLFEQPDINGGLIGGASLNAESFLTICRSAG